MVRDVDRKKKKKSQNLHRAVRLCSARWSVQYLGLKVFKRNHLSLNFNLHHVFFNATTGSICFVLLSVFLVIGYFFFFLCRMILFKFVECGLCWCLGWFMPVVDS